MKECKYHAWGATSSILIQQCINCKKVRYKTFDGWEEKEKGTRQRKQKPVIHQLEMFDAQTEKV